ncbi:MAG TPA: YjjG family noncanonical pyrimidine nucleotidase [Ferruginibacter sp.]|nr:noncanonical pyrimidine nucleotidase, YjjG family [Chitinophagaceae bacterium]HMT96091.1 YjjG family noncanonical pyrimidine nucleotidase [Ferruginibacter sp.]HMU23645.1 YjjG family noncanonical pyrimidine nucleotidase [Ferruginibacter sp.]
MKYRHLFFDLDHTLWDFDHNARISLRQIFGLYQLEKIASFQDFYRNYLLHNAALWEKYEKGLIKADELKWKRMWRTLLDFKVADEPLARKLSENFLEILPDQKNVFPHTFEILGYLQQKNYQLHLITNGFEKTQWRKLNSSGLHKFFTRVITSEASNSIKPNKEIFDYALQAAGAGLTESIMIGDNPETDIKGALNAGLDAVFVNHINVATDIKSTFTVTHLQQLEEIF